MSDKLLVTLIIMSIVNTYQQSTMIPVIGGLIIITGSFGWFFVKIFNELMG